MREFPRLLVISAVFVSFAIAAPTLAKDAATPLVLKPATPWQSVWDDDSCRMARIFGEGDDKIAFYLERYEPGDRFFLMAAGSPLAAGRNAQAVFMFGPNGKEKEGDGENGTFGSYKPALFEGNMSLMPLSDDTDEAGEAGEAGFDPEAEAADTDVFGQELTPAQEARITYLDIVRKRGRPVRLNLGAMDKPMAALRSCMDELVTSWGIDMDAHRALTRAVAPASSPGRWLTARDYPSQLLQKNMQGLVQFRLMVGTDGKPTGCHIQRSTRPEGFDKAVCNGLMRRAEFEPALGSDGTPVASFWRSSVRFDIPGR